MIYRREGNTELERAHHGVQRLLLSSVVVPGMNSCDHVLVTRMGGVDVSS